MSRLYLLFDFTTLIIKQLQDPFNLGCCRFKNVNSHWEEDNRISTFWPSICVKHYPNP